MAKHNELIAASEKSVPTLEPVPSSRVQVKLPLEYNGLAPSHKEFMDHEHTHLFQMVFCDLQVCGPTSTAML